LHIFIPWISIIGTNTVQPIKHTGLRNKRCVFATIDICYVGSSFKDFLIP